MRAIGYTANRHDTLAKVPALAAQHRARQGRPAAAPTSTCVEINEAFASVALQSSRDLGIDESKVNVNGGAVALGHPVGASGARLLTTLIYELRRRGGGRGLAAICSGGGQGDATLLEVARAVIDRIAVVGAGQMGAGIAQVAATAGATVVLVDAEAARLERALRRHPALARQARREGPGRRRRGRARAHLDLDASSGRRPMRGC